MTLDQALCTGQDNLATSIKTAVWMFLKAAFWTSLSCLAQTAGQNRHREPYRIAQCLGICLDRLYFFCHLWVNTTHIVLHPGSRPLWPVDCSQTTRPHHRAISACQHLRHLSQGFYIFCSLYISDVLSSVQVNQRQDYEWQYSLQIMWLHQGMLRSIQKGIQTTDEFTTFTKNKKRVGYVTSREEGTREAEQTDAKNYRMLKALEDYQSRLFKATQSFV